MTDYASTVAAAEPSWTWWMTTAAAAAVRMRNLREHHGGDDDDDDDDYYDDGPDRKRARHEHWTSGSVSRGWDEDAATAVGPLDLSVKATVTTAARVTDGRAADHRKDRHAATTPTKRSTAANGKSSKKPSGKTTGGGGGGATAAAVKAATRKLLPQLMLDHGRVDRSSPVSGTIIVPAAPDPQSARGPSPPSPYAAADEGRPRDDDYDGGDIDPEYNVVVATDEARRRLESIPNALGPYRCRLCSVRYVDAFALARHRCRCIVHVRYRCPECDKVFQCPANLASHRRWHGAGTKSSGGAVNANSNNNNNNDDDGGGGDDKGTADDNGALGRTETAADEKAVDGGGETTVATPPATCSAAPAAVTMNVTGFKKNILQRAVQAAAAAAARHETVGVTENVS